MKSRKNVRKRKGKMSIARREKRSIERLENKTLEKLSSSEGLPNLLDDTPSQIYVATKTDQYFVLNPDRILAWLRARWSDSPVEATGIVLLGNGWRYEAEILIATGNVWRVTGSMERMIQPAVLAGAHGLAFWHIHPNELCAYFSPMDLKHQQILIKQLKACKIEYVGAYLIAPESGHYLNREQIESFDLSKFDSNKKMVFVEHDPNCLYQQYIRAHGAPMEAKI